MPRQVPAIPDAVVLRELDALSPSICITTAQAAMVLGTTTAVLEERRRAGTPPPFISDGDIRGKVRYPIGPLREHIRSNTHHNTAAARASIEQRYAGLGFATEADFFALGQPDDEWAFALVGPHQRPVSIFRSLSMDLDDEVECVWLTLMQYGEHLTEAVRIEHIAQVKGELEAGIGEVSDVCPRCRKPMRPGHRCRHI